MILRFDVIQRNFPSALTVKQPELYTELGWQDLIGKPGWMDTCAIRMSLALVKSGVVLPGRMRIKAGPHKGKSIEPGQALLSKILARPTYLGTPEAYDKANGDLQARIGQRRGIVSFFRLDPDSPVNQGHIDMVSPARGYAECQSYCYWTSKRVWFWPLA